MVAGGEKTSCVLCTHAPWPHGGTQVNALALASCLPPRAKRKEEVEEKVAVEKVMVEKEDGNGEGRGDTQ